MVGKASRKEGAAEDYRRRLTEQDFGKDAKAWRKWIERHVK
jgi:hypothetical protein